MAMDIYQSCSLWTPHHLRQMLSASVDLRQMLSASVDLRQMLSVSVDLAQREQLA